MNITKQVVVDMILLGYVMAIVVMAGTPTSCWFKVGGIEPCVFLLSKWGSSVMCSTKTFYVCRAFQNALNFMFFLCVGGCHWVENQYR